jgi:hypothetical protein
VKITNKSMIGDRCLGHKDHLHQEYRARLRHKPGFTIPGPSRARLTRGG